MTRTASVSDNDIVDFIVAYCRQHTGGGGPTQAEIASHFGKSRSWPQVPLARLKQAGEIIQIPRRGYYPAQPSTHPVPPPVGDNRQGETK